MKRIHSIKALQLVLVFMFSTLMACDDHKSGHDDHDGHDHKESAAKQKRGQKTADKEPEGGHSEGVALSSRAIERSEIKTQAVQEKALTSMLTTVAEVELDPSKVAHIASLTKSRIADVYAFEGQVVTKNTKLLKLQSLELRAARAELQQAQANTTAARKDYERSKVLNKQNIVSARALNEAQRKYQVAKSKEAVAKTSVRLLSEQTMSGGHAIIKSPIDGVVLKRHATVGEIIDSEDTTFKIADTSTVWVVGQVFEQDAARVAVGQNVTVTLHAYPGRTWSGKVEHIHPALREDTHSLPIRVVLDNKEGLLRPGMFGSLHIQLEANVPKTPVVPEEAIQTMKGQSVVFVEGSSPGRFEKRVVTLGVRQSGFVEITKGIRIDERIVVKGSFVLKSHMLREELGHGHAH